MKGKKSQFSTLFKRRSKNGFKILIERIKDPVLKRNKIRQCREMEIQKILKNRKRVDPVQTFIDLKKKTTEKFTEINEETNKDSLKAKQTVTLKDLMNRFGKEQIKKDQKKKDKNQSIRNKKVKMSSQLISIFSQSKVINLFKIKMIFFIFLIIEKYGQKPEEIRNRVKGYFVKYMLHFSKFSKLFFVVLLVIFQNCCQKNSARKSPSKSLPCLTSKFLLLLYDDLLGYFSAMVPTKVLLTRPSCRFPYSYNLLFCIFTK